MKIKQSDAGQYLKENKFRLSMIILSISLFSLFLISGFSRHLNYMTSINDLGHFDQAIWGFLKGLPFLNTDIFNTQISRLGGHFDPILAFFVPFYLIYPSVGWLIIAQSLALSMACWPVFFLAKKIFHSEKTAFIWAVIFSLNPFILNAAAWDSNPVTLAVPFIAGSFLAVEMKKLNWLLFCCIFILLCKEHFGLLVIGFGILWEIKHREWRPALFLVALGMAHAWLVFNIIMPHFSPTGRHLMLSEKQGQLSRYVWLGNSMTGIIVEIIKNPFSTLWTVLYDFKGALYLLLILLPFLCLPLVGIEFLLPGLADLGANLLSANPFPRSISSYHSATLITVCTIAAMYGAKRTAAFIRRYSSKELSNFLLLNALVLGWVFFPFFNLPGSFNVWEQKTFFKFHDPKLVEAKKTINQEFSISVQANVGHHFTQRQKIYIFPNKIKQVDAIILRLESPTNRETTKYLRHHLQMTPTDYFNTIEPLLNNTEYKIAYWNYPWLIFTKNDGANQFSSLDTSQIQKKIADLKLLWQPDDMRYQK